MILFRSSDIGALPRRLLIERRGLFREIPFFLAGGKARRPISGRRRIISADDIGYPELISADVIGYPELTSSFALMLDILLNITNCTTRIRENIYQHYYDYNNI